MTEPVQDVEYTCKLVFPASVDDYNECFMSCSAAATAEQAYSCAAMVSGEIHRRHEKAVIHRNGMIAEAGLFLLIGAAIWVARKI